jgi:hypothetical protein
MVGWTVSFIIFKYASLRYNIDSVEYMMANLRRGVTRVNIRGVNYIINIY